MKKDFSIEELKQRIQDFAQRFGLLGLMTALPTTPEFITYDAVYLPKNHFIKQETLSTEDYLAYFFPFDKISFVKKDRESTWNTDSREMFAVIMTLQDKPQAVLMKRTENSLDAKQVLSVIEKYSLALDLLDDYDHQTMKRPNGSKTVYILSYEECRQVIDSMKFSADSDLFGNEKDDSFKGSIGNIYQSFAGQDIYPTLEEKAANLLYFITKNHSFSDGNKRIAATMFLYFLDKNGILFADGNKLIDDHTLVALTIMIAESKPDEKEMMISVIMNCICG